MSEGEETMTTTSQFVVPAPRRTRRSSEQVAADRVLVGRIRASLNRNPVAVVRALEMLFAAQTRDEQVVAETVHTNERGFSQADARTGTWLVQVVIAGGRDAGFTEEGLLRGKALEMGRRIASKYVRTQLLSAAKAKQAAAEYEVALVKSEEEARIEAAAAAGREPFAAERSENRVPFYVIARMMAGPNPSDEEGAFWDSWKDEMKERY